jgi:Na+-translocating ferredoxin:NAD+ oxidoreductase subunit D
MPKKTLNVFEKTNLFNESFTKHIKISLIILVSYFIVMTILNYGFIFGIQHLINVVIVIFAVRESEILFYSHDKNLNREEAKAFVIKNQYLVTALTISIFIPYFTPVVISIITALVSVMITKLVFGGYLHRIFSPALVSLLILSIGFRISLTSSIIPSTFDNQIFIALSKTRLFSEFLNFQLSLDPNSIFTKILLSGFGLFVIYFIRFMIRNFKVMIYPILAIAFYLLSNVVIQGNISFDGLFLNVAVLFIFTFVLSDALISPNSQNSKMISALLLGLISALLNSINQEFAIVYAALFVQMLTPMMDQNAWLNPSGNSTNLSGPKYTKYTINFGFMMIVLLVVIQVGWSYYGPLIGKPKINVIQYFEVYNNEAYTQNLTPLRDYLASDYDSIQDVYEIVNNETTEVEVLMYNMVSTGFWGPINVIVVVDPYTDTIIDYYVVRHEEVQGAAYFDQESIDAVIGLSVDNFDIPQDLNAGATGTWNALQSIVSDLIQNYNDQEVSLNEGSN